MHRALITVLLCGALLSPPLLLSAQSGAAQGGETAEPDPPADILPLPPESPPESAPQQEPLPESPPAQETSPESKPEPPSPPQKRPDSSRKMSQGNFITYGGILLGAGAAYVNYHDWIGSSEKSLSTSGYYVNPVLCMIILIPPFCGQTEAGVSAGAQDESTTSVTSTRLAGKVKYLYDLSGPFSIGGGVGTYCEIPPASKAYDGAGFTLHAGGICKLSSEWLIIADIEYSTGYFGMGHDSTKNSFGINAGVLTRLGNL